MLTLRSQRSRALFILPLVAALAVTVSPVVSPAGAATSQDRLVSANPADHTPHVLDGTVLAIARAGNRIVVGGSFTQVQEAGGTAVLNRRNVFAFDAGTGAIDLGFAPAVDDRVNAIEVDRDGSAVFLGGDFATVNGARSKGLAKLSLSTGAAVAGFRTPPMNGKVMDLALSANGSQLYVAGTYSQIASRNQPAFAAIHPGTGVLDSSVNLNVAGPLRGGQLKVDKLAMSPNGKTLLLIGNFSSMNGQRRMQLASVDLDRSPIGLANWATEGYAPDCNRSFDTYLRDVDISPDGRTFVVVTTGAYKANLLCDTAAGWDLTASGSDIRPKWVAYTGGDTLLSVAVTGAVTYVGGHQRWLNNPFAADRAGPGAVSRPGIAALDTTNGLPLSWNPTRSRGVGAAALLATADGLWVGSDTTQLGREYHGRLGFFPLAGGKSLPPGNTGALPADVYRVAPTGGGDQLVKSFFSGDQAGSPSVFPTSGINWGSARGAAMVDGTLYLGWQDGNLYYRKFTGKWLGAAKKVNLYGLTAFAQELPSITGMYITDGKLHYTLAGHQALYYRYFTTESKIVGAQRFQAAGALADLDWTKVGGMFWTGGSLYYATNDGRLRRADAPNGVPRAGTSSVVSGPGIDAIDWRSRGLFLFAG